MKNIGSQGPDQTYWKTRFWTPQGFCQGLNTNCFDLSSLIALATLDKLLIKLLINS